MKKRLLILLAFLVLVCTVWFILPDTALGTYGINKTVGWAWDISNYLPYLLAALLCIVISIASLVLLFKQPGSK